MVYRAFIGLAVFSLLSVGILYAEEENRTVGPTNEPALPQAAPDDGYSTQDLVDDKNALDEIVTTPIVEEKPDIDESPKEDPPNPFPQLTFPQDLIDLLTPKEEPTKVDPPNPFPQMAFPEDLINMITPDWEFDVLPPPGDYPIPDPDNLIA